MASNTQAPVVAQATVHANPQNTSCLQRSFPCSIYVIMISVMIIFAGAVNIGMGANSATGLSDNFYESFPHLRTEGLRQRNAGIAVLVIGLVVMILGISWCRYAKRNFRTPQPTFSGTTMTTTVIAPNTGSTSGVVQPPQIQGPGGQPTYVYSYQPAQQAGSIQQVQTGMYQYPTGQPMAQPSAPSETMPDQPPPTYQEIVHPTNDSKYNYGQV